MAIRPGRLRSAFQSPSAGHKHSNCTRPRPTPADRPRFQSPSAGHKHSNSGGPPLNSGSPRLFQSPSAGHKHSNKLELLDRRGVYRSFNPLQRGISIPTSSSWFCSSPPVVRFNPLQRGISIPTGRLTGLRLRLFCFNPLQRGISIPTLSQKSLWNALDHHYTAFVRWIVPTLRRPIV